MPPASVTAEGLGLRGPRGWVYREIGFRAEPGELVAVEGPAGSGRTSLLLTLSGRMKPTAGHAEVNGLRLPEHAARVRRIAALGPVPGVNDLEGALTVGEHLRERRLLRPLGRGKGGPAALTPAEALELVGLDGIEHRTPVRELDGIQHLRLATALALLGRPALLCVDDADERLHSTDRTAAWRMLRTVADSGCTVLAATTDTGSAGELPDHSVHLVQQKETADARA